MEVVISAAILVIVIGLTMSGMLYSVSDSQRSSVQNELDIDVQAAMERLKYEMRLTSQDQMYFYPAGSGPYTAISFPIAEDSDGDGVLEVDPSTGKLLWDKQVVYHVWSGDPSQLRRTIFNTRTNLTAVQRQQQLNSVVTNGNGQATFEGTSTATSVLFENLFTWSLSPRTARFDGYADVLQRQYGNLGSCVVTGGMNTFRFRLVGRNAASSGYKVGIDTLTATPSYGQFEGEDLLTNATYSGATPTARYVSAGSWSGNYDLYFPATATGHYFTVAVENDRWMETNFRAEGETHRDTTVLFDSSLNPQDCVVCLDGNKTNWTASAQADDTNGASRASEDYRGAAVRVLIKGWQMAGGGWLDASGGRCQVLFRAGDDAAGLAIRKATIAACSSSVAPSMDASGTMCDLTFGGNTALDLAPGAQAYTDLADFTIDKTNSYLVSFLVTSAAGKGSVWQWDDTNATSSAHAYVIPVVSGPVESTVGTAVWSTRSDVYPTSAIPAVGVMFVAYATNGVYTSTIHDTHLPTPAYSSIVCAGNIPSGSAIDMKIRTSPNSDMSGAPTWDSIAVISGPFTSPGSGRYVQFQARLRPTADCLQTSKLKSVTIRWPGITSAVDIGGIFTKGPDYGVFELEQVGQQGVLSGVYVQLSIFEDVRAFGGTNRLTSTLAAEVKPRNTGR